MIIDEAHSSQGGKAAAAPNAALTGEDEETVEDKINAIMEQRKMLPNASYFAFTATPKNRALEIFGEPFTEGDTIKHRPLRCCIRHCRPGTQRVPFRSGAAA
jgi:type I restriction enzyme, R subunit